MTPYISKELKMNLREYKNLCSCLEVLFEWVENTARTSPFHVIRIIFSQASCGQMRDCLPDVYEVLIPYVKVLPGNTYPIAHPFSGFVINVNVSTRVHRDSHDLVACLVLPIGDFKKGDLVLKEPGLVIPLQSGDGVVFPSGDITHFNLNYEGKRASLVLHSDKAGVNWVKDRNGWKMNDYLDDTMDWQNRDGDQV